MLGAEGEHTLDGECRKAGIEVLELGEFAAAGPPGMQTLPSLMRAWGMDVVTP